jgi:hypothetical protein
VILGKRESMIRLRLLVVYVVVKFLPTVTWKYVILKSVEGKIEGRIEVTLRRG